MREGVSEASVCAGDTSLNSGIGGSSTGAGGIEALVAGAGVGLSATFFRGWTLRVATLGEGDLNCAAVSS